MTTPFSHYPADADFAALWRELRDYCTDWQARKVRHRTVLMIKSGERETAKANLVLFHLDKAGRLYRLRAIDRVSMLDTWCGEARELLWCNESLLSSPRLPRRTRNELRSYGFTLTITIFLADITRKELKKRLKT